MPNWVTNRLKIKSSIIEKFISKDEYDEDYLDFNKIIPMPKDLEIESGSKGQTGLMILYYLSSDNKMKQEINRAYRSTNPFSEDIELSPIYSNIISDYEKNKNDSETKITIEMGEKYFNNYKKYGYTDWYNWACDIWGTKWNAQSLYRLDDDIYEFITAWSSPLPIFKKLSELYPQETVEVDFADEDIGSNCGTIKFMNGEIIEYINQENNVKFACDINGIDYEDLNDEIDY